MDTITYEMSGRVALIGLNRPERLNAIDDQLRVELRAAIDRFTDDPEARVAILFGEGRAFCTGMDLSPGGRYAVPNIAADRDHVEALAQDWLRLFDCPKPIIAQVHGYCLAGGTQLPLCCDFTVIADDTVVGWPKLPMGAGWISPMWAHTIGVQRAKLMSYRVGSTITGRQAAEWGYAALSFPAETLAAETLAIAQDIARLPSDMLRIKKLANNRVLERSGFREAALAGAEWDAIAHSTQTVADMRAMLKELGVKDSIATFARDGL